MTVREFQKIILGWYKRNNRDWLPWRKTRNPYHILISEIMLQQTQVSRVVQKYPEFLKAFPTIQNLANTPLRSILQVWQGMGYNRRALYVKRIAKEVARKYKGKIPSEPKVLQQLPGIGHYTAGAVACFAFGKPVVFLDTNIRKVLIYHFFNDRKKGGIADNELLKTAQAVLYKKNPRMWHYALMDYGALVLTREKEILEKVDAYYKQLPFLGSSRYFRSKIVRHLLKYQTVKEEEAKKLIPKNFYAIMGSLIRDGLIERAAPGLYKISEHSDTFVD